MSYYTKRWLARTKKMPVKALPNAVNQLMLYGIANDDADAVSLAKAIPAHIHEQAFKARVMQRISDHIANRKTN